MRKIHFVFLVFIFLLTKIAVLEARVADTHFITSEQYRKRVSHDFNVRRKELSKELFTVFRQEMNNYEREAMEFLYAYMPIADIADYSSDFFLNNIRLSTKVRKEMSWGSSIPEDVYRHFVLPLRVNNERLDDARQVFYKELKERVSGLSLEQAALAVNHWCHEKVSYQPSDARTSSPLSCVMQAKGRCGEESTFTVTALRAVGIPARQVYTPRWAHTDDNHAWVEVWVDGKWHFMGACEPEPVLDLGWFNSPASRGMLMTTKAFGRYFGTEQIIEETPLYSYLNVTEHYAQTALVTVRVLDPKGKPITNALVQFRLYNYAEYYPVASMKTNHNGEVALRAGLGELLVFAQKGEQFGYTQVNFATQSQVILSLDKNKTFHVVENRDLNPPAENPCIPYVSPEMRDENNALFAYEDSVRHTYIATFMNVNASTTFANRYKLDVDKTIRILSHARGNHSVICKFLSAVIEEKRALALDFLCALSVKDLSDVTLDVLDDHWNYSPYLDVLPTDYINLVLSPRVADEMITPYKAYFQKVLSKKQQKEFIENPLALIQYFQKNICIDERQNLDNLYITPQGVWKTRLADAKSRDVCFVAILRSLGVPAWVDRVTKKVQYKTPSGEVCDANFSEKTNKKHPYGFLLLQLTDSSIVKTPTYYSHFSLSKFTSQGFQVLDYETGNSDMGATADYNGLFAKPLKMDQGYYLLTTGTRLASGGVLAQNTFFSIEQGKETLVNLTVRDSRDLISIIGHCSSEAQFCTLDNKPTSILNTTGRGYFVVGILGVGQEPTNHVLRDLAAKRKELEAWGRKIVLLFPSVEDYKKFRPEDFPQLPENVVFGVDTDGKVMQSIVKGMEMTVTPQLPVVILGDTFDRVVFSSQGYTIGLGEQLLRVIKGL